MSSDAIILIFVAVSVMVIGRFIYRMLKYGGLKAPNVWQPDRTHCWRNGGNETRGDIKLWVNALSGEEDRTVGVELVATAVASYQMIPITLSAKSAQDLISLLQEANDASNSSGEAIQRTYLEPIRHDLI